MLLYKVESNNDIVLKKKEKENPTYLVSYFFFVFFLFFENITPIAILRRISMLLNQYYKQICEISSFD